MPTGENTWSIQCHFKTSLNNEYHLFADFKILTVAEQQYFYLSWALIDPANQQYLATSEVDQRAPHIAYQLLEHNQFSQDQRFNEVLKDIFKKNRIPLPSKPIKNKTSSAKDKLQLIFGQSKFTQLKNGDYLLKLMSEQHAIDCEFTLTANAAMTEIKELDCLFFPANIQGKLIKNKTEQSINSGSAAIQHYQRNDALAKAHLAETNAVIQLNDNQYLFLYESYDRCTKASVEQFALLAKNGETEITHDFSISAKSDKKHSWRSAHSFNVYPLQFSLRVPDFNLNIKLTANLPGQEFISLTETDFIFWKGCCMAEGTLQQQDVKGNAFVTRLRFNTVNNIKQFFASVSDETYHQIQNLIPNHPIKKKWLELIATKADKHIIDGVDFERLSHSLLEPIRVIAERQGKSWRSYITLACCNAVGGDFTPYLALLTLELIHVGSLIIDDVEDKSSTRRGGPACQLIYGDAIAINAGGYAYLLPQTIYPEIFKNLPKEILCDLYEHYFEGVHSAHVGQAMDVAGTANLVESVIAGTTQPQALENYVTAIHRLKSGAPVEILFARPGALLGRGTRAQVNAIGAYMEAVGTAFQIIDDVLNLRGFEGNTKTRGEDIMEGKITFPIAYAHRYLPPEQFFGILKTVLNKPKNSADILYIINQLETCGAIQASIDHAANMVNTAWEKLDPLLAESFAKIMLRVFGKYMLDRHY